MEKWEAQKPTNRSSPKFAWMLRRGPLPPCKISSRYDYHVCPPPKYAKNGHLVTRLVFLALLSAYSKDPCIDFYAFRNVLSAWSTLTLTSIMTLH